MERRQFTREFKLEAVRLIKDRGVYRARFFGHNFDLSGVLHVGFLPGETRLARAA
jgi:hypothetical protein